MYSRYVSYSPPCIAAIRIVFVTWCIRSSPIEYPQIWLVRVPSNVLEFLLNLTRVPSNVLKFDDSSCLFEYPRMFSNLTFCSSTNVLEFDRVPSNCLCEYPRIWLVCSKVLEQTSQIRVTKMDAIEHGEECLLIKYCDDVSKTILLIKLSDKSNSRTFEGTRTADKSYSRVLEQTRSSRTHLRVLERTSQIWLSVRVPSNVLKFDLFCSRVPSSLTCLSEYP